MASDAPALPRTVSPADHVARWLDHFRRRVNWSAVDAQARKPVRILVDGPRAADLIAVLDPDAAGRSNVFEIQDSSSQPVDAATRALVYCRACDDLQPQRVEFFASSPLPVFIVEYLRPGDDLLAVATAGPEKKPVPGKPGLYRLSALSAVEMRKHFLPDLVAAYDGLEVALGSALPVLRPTVAAKLTLDCAVTCLKIAGASALADHVPLLGFVLGGIASAGDTLVITGLQVDMLLKIAATYGKRAEFARVIELLPVIGGGYAWRSLARELSGFIPVAGIAVKAAIAYAGTLVVGQAAAYYYEYGKPLTADKTTALYYDAIERAKKLASDAIDRARGKK